MAVDYADIASGALESITEFGMAMTLTTPGSGSYNAATATFTASPVSNDAMGVVLPPGAMRGSGFYFEPDVLVRASALIYLAANGLPAPKPGAKIVAGPDTWTVIGSDTLAPAGVPVLYAAAVVK